MFFLDNNKQFKYIYMFQLKSLYPTTEIGATIFKYIYMFQLKAVFKHNKEFFAGFKYIYMFQLKIYLLLLVQQYLSIQIHLYVSVKAIFLIAFSAFKVFKYIYMFQLKCIQISSVLGKLLYSNTSICFS